MNYFELENLNVLTNKEVIGIDETGVGDYFTPLVACAFYLPNHLVEWAKTIGVKDSKLLSFKQIEFLAKKLSYNLEVKWSVYRLKQSTYNKMSKEYNANELKFFIHNGAFNNLLKKMTLRNHVLLIDKYSTTKSILKYDQNILQLNNWMNFKNVNVDTFLATKAESVHLSAACASIMARYQLNLYMNEQRNKWKFNFLLGTSELVQTQVIEFEKIYGKSALNEVCKTNFKIKS
ncbi:ribonuclease HIII [Mycoplasmopsis cricetuli]|uniref:ribonuclease HIII n=1 Tax=Mycoplasmopsis cricetuli TaxID=171283 RepID=UPI000472258F|nr:ribonuclease HIII [Mycoplasmopsis cricetuli]